MKEQIKDFFIKLVFTIPALCVGFLTLFMFIFRPVIDLWKNKPAEQTPPIEMIDPDKPEYHDFH